MAKLMMDITALESGERAITQQIAQLEALNARLEALLERIGSSWDGDSSASYLRMMRGYAAQAANMVKVLTEFKQYVGRASASFAEEDRRLAAQIRGSF